MGNAAEDTPTGRDPATDPEELAARALNREVALTMEAVRKLAHASERSGENAREDQAALATIERQLGDLLHETARDREALVPRILALEQREAKTNQELVAIKLEVRRGRIRIPHVLLGLGALGLGAVGAMTGTAAVLVPVAVTALGLIGRDIARRGR